jgi:hypothetical protein
MQAIKEDKKIFKDLSANFRGTIRVRVEHLQFDRGDESRDHNPPYPRGEKEEKEAIGILANDFKTGGCFRLQPLHYVSAIVNQDTLTFILNSLKLSAEELVKYPGEPPEPKLPRNFQLRYVCGHSRIEACKKVLPAFNRWWNVKLYLDGGPELRSALVKEYSGSIRHSDSDIYKMICYFKRQGIGRDKFAEQRWWLQLTLNKMRDLKLFMKHDIGKAFKVLLQAIPGLFTGNWIGILHHILALRCDEVIKCNPLLDLC